MLYKRKACDIVNRQVKECRRAGGELKYYWAHSQYIFLQGLCLSKIAQLPNQRGNPTSAYYNQPFRFPDKPGVSAET